MLLLQAIPHELSIEKLGSSLAKLLNDYQLQVSLREGCKKILVKDRYVNIMILLLELLLLLFI